MYEFDKESGELFLYDAIGSADWGFIDSATVIRDLRAISGRRATIRLNSPGGSVDEARAIYNAMKRHPGGVDTVVDSAAYSAAGYIFAAGERRVIAENGMLMLHDPWTFAYGNSAQLRKDADVLDKYRDSIVEAYAGSSGKDADEIKAILAAETWYLAAEALAEGFATEIGNLVIGEDQWHPMAKAMASMRAKPNAKPGSRFACARPMKVQLYRK